MAKKETARTLTPVEHARLRTEMYFGARELHTQKIVGFDGKEFAIREHTWVPALWTYLREILDNALDEITGHSHGDTLTVTYDAKTMIFSVHDNGRGMPIHEIPAVGKGPAASYMMSQTLSGRNFDEREQVGGANGIGAAIVNFTSEWFEIEIDRDGTQDKNSPKNLTQRWDEAIKDGKEISKTKGPHVIRGNKNRSGSMVRFKPSAKVYKKMVLPEAFVRERVWDLAVINPKIKIIYNGERLQPSTNVDTIKSTYFATSPCATIQIDHETFHSRFYVVGNFVPDGGEIDHSLVNNIPAVDGGKHMDEFKRLFYAVAVEEIEKRVQKEVKGANVTRQMISPGVMIWNNTTMHGPNFDAQSKTRLISDVAASVRAGFHESDVRSFLRRNPEWVQSVIDRIVERLGKKENRQTKQDEDRLMRQKVARLIDATGRKAEDRILFLFEGDSAKGHFPAVRNPKVHGYLPLLGKIANVWGMTPAQVVADRVLNQIMSAVGVRTSEQFMERRLRYGKIFIATDEDEDGKNIAALLVNFFYRFWPEMFNPKKPVLYRFQTPFIRLTRGKEIKFIYAEDYEEYSTNLAKYKGWSAYRAKGLGSLFPGDWEHALEKPNLIPITDDGKIEDVLDLIFNKTRADDRKGWMRTDKLVGTK